MFHAERQTNGQMVTHEELWAINIYTYKHAHKGEYKKVKQSRYRPGDSHRVPGS